MSVIMTQLRATRFWLVLLILPVIASITPQSALAHFSYSDPRIIDVIEGTDGGVVVLMRLPAPLALLPSDWRGSDETRLPPFASQPNGEAVLDAAALSGDGADLRTVLGQSLTLWTGEHRNVPTVTNYQLWHDAERPRFGTVKTAIAVFEGQSGAAPIPYFDATVDVMLSFPDSDLNGPLRLETRLGDSFQVIEKFGTVVKLHRAEGTHTKAVIGPLDLSFPAATTRFGAVRDAALSGAEHIYRGLDHLALIVLIALAADGWRQALGWASAFTVGHIITLAAGLYGFAPSADWFIPLVEIGIALPIVLAGVAIFLRANSALGWVGLFAVGLIHGYGFAASAATALFAGDFDPSLLLAFAAGLELCQFAIYALVLPVILLVDRYMPMTSVSWRRAVALGIALCAVSATLSRLSATSGVFAVA
ncbi:HupE/UreJ family protein [Sedimentitalea sp.]|uniref:HupE/UreJ family protein n=1 Tax=Sedimentitalea sp. TaxID=2048915 RepID=UPI003296ECE8